MFQRRFSRISTEKWNSCPMVNGKRPGGVPANASMRFRRERRSYIESVFALRGMMLTKNLSCRYHYQAKSALLNLDFIIMTALYQYF